MPAPAAGGEQREAVRELRSVPDSGFKAGFRSFDDFLQADSRRPVGLEAYRETPAARPEAGGAEKKGQTSADPNPAPSRTDLREAYYDFFRAEVAQLVNDPAMLDDEMRYLAGVLAGGAV